ncbi:hypothetical protein SAMN05444008_10164 [Cnuella takakiae]|uniref:Uncharacterized protein n=1 Tax=Cnuella takakiae TaxID=1302690 RepID=A0A1M4SBW7_9BACT|nr:hypothetical protein [Cnuella takakiae]OLY94456.1 hypothetical protein BUE76_23180 [Cnuella takakiae]SHE29658.1 hypothetical protein SAMN05444008_10164 [Cnuella takakiae]
MERTTARFASLSELVDFQMITDQRRAVIDPAGCTLTGRFTEADLELAINGYQARTLSTEQEPSSTAGLRFSAMAQNSTHDQRSHSDCRR